MRISAGRRRYLRRFHVFFWLNLHKFDANIAALDTWADASLRNRSKQLISDCRRDATLFVSLDSMISDGGASAYEITDHPSDTMQPPWPL